MAGCLKSLAGVVDEVVIVDTGSKDASREIARAAGARLHHHAWNNDFAAARNAALDAASGDWILYIDADERVVGGRPESLAGQFDNPQVVGLTVRFRPATGFTVYREHRLFRRHPEIRFQGMIHETHLPDLYRVATRDRLRIEHSELALDHLGYDGDIGHKHSRNLPLLQARLRQEPDHVYSWWHLGQTLAGLGRGDEAVEAWQRGVDAARRTRQAGGDHDGSTCLPYLALLGQRSSLDGRLDEELWQEAHERFPGHPQLLWLRALARVGERRWGEAVPDLERLAVTDLDLPGAHQYATEERLFRVLAPAQLALCFFHLGRYDEAADLFRRLEAEGAGTEFSVRRRLAEIRAARAASASPGKGENSASPPGG